MEERQDSYVNRMTCRADYEAKKLEEERKERGRQVAGEAFKAHEAKIKGMENFRGFGICPFAIKVYVYPRTRRFNDQLDALTQELWLWSEDHRLDQLMEIIGVEEAPPEPPTNR